MNDRRKLTPFLAREMLFDYATGALDADRKAAVEAFIKNDRESQSLLEAIRGGIKYAGSLKSIELTDRAMEELEQAENLVSLSKRLARWSEWPDSLRWSIIAVAVSVCTAAFVVVIPWKSIPIFRAGPSFDSSSIEIARIEPRKEGGEDANLASNEGDEQKEADSGPLEGSGDEEFSDEASGVAPAQPPVTAPVAAARHLPTPIPVPPKTVAGATPKPLPTPAAVVVKPTSTPVAVAVSPPASPAAEPKSAPTTASSKASRSFVYRAFMTLNDLEDIAPKITQQIKELGAEKAGEVELGWRRGTGRYYHFTLPETNEQKLLENLRVYGPVRISKDPHPRVMPEGQVRFILWIESGS